MTTADYYRNFVDERYQVLRKALAAARRRPDWGLRLEQQAAIQAEIRALVRIRWFARRESRRRVAAIDRILSLPYHDWQALPEELDALTEDELFEGYGVDREGQPEFNGAFR